MALLRSWKASDLALANDADVTGFTFSDGVAVTTFGTVLPKYKTSSANGKAGVAFVSANSNYATATTASQAQPVSTFVVLKPTSTAGVGQVVHQGAEVLINNGRFLQWNGANLINDLVLPEQNKVFALMMVANGSTSRSEVNGSVVTGNSGTNGLGTAMTIGRHPSAGRYLSAEVQEIRQYSHALTSAETEDLLAYSELEYAVVRYVPPPSYDVVYIDHDGVAVNAISRWWNGTAWHPAKV